MGGVLQQSNVKLNLSFQMPRCFGELDRPGVDRMDTFANPRLS